ncbi:MAG: S8 family serine peptidase [Nitrospirota bacterium]|nr:S8 family serine peptidase [Nitrospirota bacterium]
MPCLVVLVLVASVSCRERLPVQPGMTPIVPAIMRDVAFAPTRHVTCTRQPGGQAFVCAQLPPTSSANADVIMAQSATTFGVAIQGVTYDGGTQRFDLYAAIVNNLGQPMGTLDGTTATSLKAFLTSAPVVQGGSGTVTVYNADGSAQFSAPGQSYWTYDQVVVPGATSTARVLGFQLTGSVSQFGFDINISAAIPAERDVAAIPPDTSASWIYDDTNLVVNRPERRGSTIAKNIVEVAFVEGATLGQKQLAIALVGGTVVGGMSLGGSPEGFFWITLRNGTADSVFAAIARLRALPQVEAAAPLYFDEKGLHVRPTDGSNWSQKDWHVEPDSARGEKWAFEAIAAPLAWGCTTGDAGTNVAIVDRHFETFSDIAPNLNTNASRGIGGIPGETEFTHGSTVAALLAAQGNNNQGISGMAWAANLRVYDARRQLSGQVGTNGATFTPDWIARAARSGARVINVSLGLSYEFHPEDNSPDTNRSADRRRSLVKALRSLRHATDIPAANRRPLIVFAAGNNGVDAKWNGYPQAKSVDDFATQILVVGGAARGDSLYNHSEFDASNFGPLVDIVAPADSVVTLDGSGSRIAVRGTSGAAPLVSGVAALIMSLDPSLRDSTSAVRALILAGADSNQRGNGTHRQVTGRGGPYRMLNAYESLREVARRAGGPLCGNRIWVHADSVTVERRGGPTPIDETILLLPALPPGSVRVGASRVDVPHNGRRIVIDQLIEGGDGMSGRKTYELNVATRHWELSSITDPTSRAGGTWLTSLGNSHDLDSGVTTRCCATSSSIEFSAFAVNEQPSQWVTVPYTFTPINGGLYGFPWSVSYSPRGGVYIGTTSTVDAQVESTVNGPGSIWRAQTRQSDLYFVNIQARSVMAHVTVPNLMITSVGMAEGRDELVVMGVSGFQRMGFGTLALNQYPSAIDFCGTRYYGIDRDSNGIPTGLTLRREIGSTGFCRSSGSAALGATGNQRPATIAPSISAPDPVAPPTF